MAESIALMLAYTFRTYGCGHRQDARLPRTSWGSWPPARRIARTLPAANRAPAPHA